MTEAILFGVLLFVFLCFLVALGYQEVLEVNKDERAAERYRRSKEIRIRAAHHREQLEALCDEMLKLHQVPANSLQGERIVSEVIYGVRDDA